MMEYVIIKVKRETRDALKSLGKKGETYDDIIRRLIDALKKFGGI
jgi:hypothetical protein